MVFSIQTLKQRFVSESETSHFKCLWSDLVHYFQKSLVLLILTPQTVIFGFLNSTSSDYTFKKNKLLINRILLIFKLYVYRSREKEFIHINIPKIKSPKRQKKKLLQVTKKRQ